MVAASGGHTQVVNDILDMGTGTIDQKNLVCEIATLLFWEGVLMNVPLDS